MRNIFSTVALSGMILLCAMGSAASGDSTTTSAVRADVRIGLQIENRELLAPADTVPVSAATVYCWTRITGTTEPTTIRHIWLQGGTEMARVELSVGSSPWRTWSSKQIMAGFTGQWTVRIEDSNGTALAEKSFLVVP